MKERLNAQLHENEDAVARSWEDVYLLLLPLWIFYPENIAVLAFNGFELVLDAISLYEVGNVNMFFLKYISFVQHTFKDVLCIWFNKKTHYIYLFGMLRSIRTQMNYIRMDSHDCTWDTCDKGITYTHEQD